MERIVLARRLRRHPTTFEKELWRAVRAGHFAGFKFRRQHPVGKYILDCYCPSARLAVELDGFQHGLREGLRHDGERDRFLAAQGIEVLRFWNRQWKANRDGVLLEIWHALHRRTGCVSVERMEQNHQFVPPDPGRLIGEVRPLPRGAPSPPEAGGEGGEAGIGANAQCGT